MVVDVHAHLSVRRGHGHHRSPEAYLRRFWLDWVSYYDPAMAAGIACVGVEHIVMGSDTPFAVGDLRRSVESIRALARILGPNAEAFLTGRSPS